MVWQFIKLRHSHLNHNFWYLQVQLLELEYFHPNSRNSRNVEATNKLTQLSKKLLKVFFHQKKISSAVSKMNFTDFFTSLHIYWHVRGLSIHQKNLSYYYFFVTKPLILNARCPRENNFSYYISPDWRSTAKISPEI